MLFDRIARWRRQRRLRSYRIPVKLWQLVVDDALSHFNFNKQELHRLRELASLFLQRKSINGADGLEVDEYMRAVIAATACVLILNLDLDYYDGWVEIIVYPDSFVVVREEQDEIGLIHERRAVLGGEAWGRGPLILSWHDARPGAHIHGKGSNVILHEFAHKLDMLDGTADGTPPLHKNMSLKQWVESFTAAYNNLHQRIERHTCTCIDPYGAENPAEFFAVVTEEFFELPSRLHKYFPAVYEQLVLFYKQNPLKRMREA